MNKINIWEWMDYDQKNKEIVFKDWTRIEVEEIEDTTWWLKEWLDIYNS